MPRRRGWKLIPIGSLKPHERTMEPHVREIRRLIEESGVMKEPIIVEGEHLIILDGHHRTEALRRIGAKAVPAVVVNYGEIRLLARRKSRPVTKELVVETALAGRVFPPKTTKHLVGNRIRGTRIPLELLVLAGEAAP